MSKPAGDKRPPAGRSIGFGLERIGLAALGRPRLAALLLLVLTIAAATSIPRLPSDAALSDLFRADTPAYRAHRDMMALFPSGEFDLLLLVEGGDLFRRDEIEAVRDLHVELELTDGVAGVLSAFSMRRPPGADGTPEPLFPDDLPGDDALQDLVAEAEAHPLARGKLIGRDAEGGGLLLLVVSLEPAVIASEGLKSAVATVEKTAREALAGAPVRLSIAGGPALQLEIRQAIRRDRLIYNTAGFAVGFVICLVFFARPSLVLLASLCPAVAVIWALGMLGHMGLRLNTLINVIPPLIMVITFCDSMHLLHRVRRDLGAGADRFAAARAAVCDIGPACALTAIVTSASALSLAFTQSALIANFALGATLSLIAAFVAVITIVPAGTVLLFDDEARFRASERGTRNVALLAAFAVGIGRLVARRRRAIVAGGAALTLAFAAMHLSLEPRYRLAEQLPIGSDAARATARIDERLGGSQPIDILVRWQDALGPDDPAVAAVVSRAHDALAAEPAVSKVWSNRSLEDWLKGAGVAEDAIARLRDEMGEPVKARLASADGRAALVTGYVPDLGAGATAEIVASLERRLAPIRAEHPGFRLDIAGLTAVSAVESRSMIAQLNINLIGSILTVMAIIAIAFRSLRLALLSALPNILPIFAAGAVLYASGSGLEYASVIALDIAFGLAVDDTIHFLNHLSHEERPGEPVEKAVERTLDVMGPVVILTTMVLVLGLSVTVLSVLPPMRLFGMLMMGSLAAALVADLVLLPAEVMLARRWLAVTTGRAGTER
ncbi:MAG: MMPL family transporter [Hyphomicrobiaceae bacterium]